MIRFAKYHGLGNDFILIDLRKECDSNNAACVKLPDDTQYCKNLCDRHRGVGADGVIFALPSRAEHGNNADFEMKVINSDGSVAAMCGNGIRCLAKFVYDCDSCTGSQNYSVLTASGLRSVSILDETTITVNMGKPMSLNETNTGRSLSVQSMQTEDFPRRVVHCSGEAFNLTCISMGNPHAVSVNCCYFT
jgi:diaminopimelate epimerase